MSKLILSLLLVAITSVALAQPPNPTDEKGQQKYETNIPKIGDTVIEDKLRQGKVISVDDEYTTIEVKIPMKEIKPLPDFVGKFPVESLPPNVRPKPLQPVDDVEVKQKFKAGDYVELKDGRQGTIKSVIKVPAVGIPKLITYEIAFTEMINSTSVEKKFSRRKPIELGDIVLYLGTNRHYPKKMLGEVTFITDVDDKKAYHLKPINEKTTEVIAAMDSDIWDGNVVWMQMGNEKVMPEFINDSDGTLIYGDRAKWDKMPKNFKELPPKKGKK